MWLKKRFSAAMGEVSERDAQRRLRLGVTTQRRDIAQGCASAPAVWSLRMSYFCDRLMAFPFGVSLSVLLRF